jgi:hypothetical protein
MRQGRILFATVLSLVCTAALADPPATTPPASSTAAQPVDVLNLDFSKAADQAKMMVNGNASFTADGRLELTSDVSQAGSAFTTTPVPATADYLATFQFEVKSLAGAAPADGFAFVTQQIGPDTIGDGGGSLGYANGAKVFGQNSYAVEFNTYSGNGLGNGNDQTIAWDAFGQRLKLDQSAWPDTTGFVDQGVFTAEVRVQPNNMTVTVSGGTNNLKPTEVMSSKFLALFANPPPPLFQTLAAKPIFFGFTGGTGGLGAVQDILNLRIQSPAPAAAPTNPAPTAGP